MTENEQKWFASLKRVLQKMPDSVEIQVHNNSIQMNRKGARDEEFALRGNADAVDDLDAFSTTRMRVYPCGESM